MALDHTANVYSSIEINPNNPLDLNILIIKKEWYKTIFGYIIAVIPIVFGCLIEFEFAKTIGNSTAQLDINAIKGLFKFQGGTGAALVLLGLLLVFITRFEVKNESIKENKWAIRGIIFGVIFSVFNFIMIIVLFMVN